MKRLNIATHSSLKNMTYIRKKIDFTRHATQRVIEKNMIVPNTIEIKAGQVVELEMDGTLITKVVVRQSMNKTQDLVLVLVPKGTSTWLAITAWINNVTDTHKTLKTDRISI